MARNCLVQREVQNEARIYRLGNGEYIRIVNGLVGVRVIAVIDVAKFAKLTFDSEELRMMVDKEGIYVGILDRDEGKKFLYFNERYMEWEKLELILRTLLELFPEHHRSKSVSG